MITFEEIKKLGLPEKETKVYWAMFRLGSAFPSAIAKEAGVNRATAYEILNRLHLKGLVMKMVKRNKYFFSCAEPEAFREYISSRQKNLENLKREYEKMLPELSYFYSNNIYKPRIYFYEGMEGVRQAIFDMLEGEHEEVIGFTSVKTVDETLDDRIIRSFVKEKIKRGIRSRYLNYDQNGEAEIKKYVSKYYRRAPKAIIPQFKVVPSKNQALNLINIYGKNVSIIDLNHPELMAIVVENKDIADTFLVLFNEAWKES